MFRRWANEGQEWWVVRVVYYFYNGMSCPVFLLTTVFKLPERRTGTIVQVGAADRLAHWLVNWQGIQR